MDSERTTNGKGGTGPARIEVWEIPTPAASAPDPTAVPLLDEHERRILGQLASRTLQARYAAAHAAVRRILANRLQCRPEAVALTRQARGKPCLARQHGPTRPALSVTHGRARSLLAVGPVARLGVDLEPLDRTIDVAALIETVLTAAEARYVRACNGADRHAALLRCWTRKEAWLKATGQGLSVDPRDIGCTNGDGGMLSQDFWIGDLLLPDARAALAVADAAPELIYHRFEW